MDAIELERSLGRSNDYGLGIEALPTWPRRAACRDEGVDPEIFFPGRGQSATDARRVCARCPVAGDCLAYAVENKLEGIWAGTSGKQRRRLARRRRKAG